MNRLSRIAFHICSAALVAAAILSPAALRAQDGPALIRQGISAYNDFDTQRALALLRRGLNPAAGPQDSLWAQGVQFLAQALFDEGQQPLMDVWVRWAIRIAPDMSIDTLNLVSGVISAFEDARAATAPGPSDAVTTTQARWPAGDPGSGPGRLQVTRPDVPVPVTILVVGRGVVAPGQSISLSAGSYEVQASADGYQPVQVTREVLPGITTVLTFDLQPVVTVVEGELSEAVRRTVLQQVTGITVYRFGVAPACGAGAIVGRDGLLITTYRAIRGADSVAVRMGARQFGEEVRVAAYDVTRDIAVLKLPLIRPDSLPLTSEITDDQYAWGFGFSDCGSPTDHRLRIATWTDRPNGRLVLRDSLEGAVIGSPLVDQEGAVVGLWTDPLAAIAAPGTETVLGDARRSIVERSLQTLAAVGGAENHRYGSVAISAAATGVVARIVPQEIWQWPALEQTAFLPLTFAGPAGRYRLELTVNGRSADPVEFTLRPGVADRLPVDLGEPVAPVQAGIERSGGGFPWIIVLLGGGGAAAAAALLLGGGDGDGDGPPATTGSITIRFRDP